MVQDYNNTEKIALLTQASTIQQCSQYLFLLVAFALQKQRMKIMLQEIMQAYTQ